MVVGAPPAVETVVRLALGAVAVQQFAQSAERAAGRLAAVAFHTVRRLAGQHTRVRRVVLVQSEKQFGQPLGAHLRGVDVGIRRRDGAVIDSSVNDRYNVTFENLEQLLRYVVPAKIEFRLYVYLFIV